MADAPTGACGIPAYDLARDMTARATRALAAQIAADARTYSPLRIGLSPAAMEAQRRKIAEQNAARDREVSVVLTAALVDWDTTRHAHAGNPAALAVLAVLDIHKPVRGYQGAVCSECRESDGDDTVPVDWPCATFTAIEQEATGG